MFVNALEGTLVLRKPLDYETLANFSVDIRAQVSNDSLNVNINSPKTLLIRFNVFFYSQDQGNPPKSSTTTLYVNVIDADDQNPAFQNDQYKILIPRNIKTVILVIIEHFLTSRCYVYAILYFSTELLMHYRLKEVKIR